MENLDVQYVENEGQEMTAKTNEIYGLEDENMVLIDFSVRFDELEKRANALAAANPGQRFSVTIFRRAQTTFSTVLTVENYDVGCGCQIKYLRQGDRTVNASFAHFCERHRTIQTNT